MRGWGWNNNHNNNNTRVVPEIGGDKAACCIRWLAAKPFPKAGFQRENYAQLLGCFGGEGADALVLPNPPSQLDINS